MCGENYHLGYKFDSNSTKCYPIGTDMNTICNSMMKNNNKNNNINFGYEKLMTNGCPHNFIRSTCSGGFYDGNKLFKNETKCFSQNLNPDRICKEHYGQSSYSTTINSSNCLPGNIRALCKHNN